MKGLESVEWSVSWIVSPRIERERERERAYSCLMMIGKMIGTRLNVAQDQLATRHQLVQPLSPVHELVRSLANHRDGDRLATHRGLVVVLAIVARTGSRLEQLGNLVDTHEDLVAQSSRRRIGLALETLIDAIEQMLHVRQLGRRKVVNLVQHRDGSLSHRNALNRNEGRRQNH